MIMRRVAEQERLIKTRDELIKWNTPKPGDLVMIRRHELDNQKGRKLESRWDGPKLLVRFSARGNSGFVQEVHGDGKEKRYYVDNIRVYVEREGMTILLEGVSGVGYERGLAEHGAKVLGGEKG